MIGSVVGRRYAKALLELGAESGTLDALVREISEISAAIEASTELCDVRDNPQVSRPARKAVFAEIAQRAGASATTRNTIGLLIDNGRLRVLPEIARSLREEADRRAGVLRAQVTSAAPLAEAYVGKLQAALEKRFGKKVVLQRGVDPSLLAGIVTRVGDTIIDGSLKAHLHELKQGLLPR